MNFICDLTCYLDQAECPRSVFELHSGTQCSSSCRQVGVCLKHLPSSSANANHHFHDANVPWQRVINAKGIISPRSALRTPGSHSIMADTSYRGPGGALRQAASLRREGVTVGTGHLGELSVDLGAYGWFPELLPSDEAEASESEEENDGVEI